MAPATHPRFAVLWNEIDPHWVDSVHNWQQQLGEPGDRWDIFHTPLGSLPDRADDYDAYVVTGSQHSVNDPTQTWVPQVQTFLRAAAAAPVRIVGSCFGAQLLGTALGGRVGSNPGGGYVLGVEAVEPLSPDPILTATTPLHQSHGEWVEVLPPGARLVARSASCPHEAFWVGDDILALQAHPELSRSEVRDRILATRLADGRTSPEEAASVRGSLEHDHAGPEVMARLSRFLRRV